MRTSRDILQEAFFALSHSRNRQFQHYRGRSSPGKRSLSCRVMSTPRQRKCRYTGKDVGVDCLFCSWRLAMPVSDKQNFVPRLLLRIFSSPARDGQTLLLHLMIHIGKRIKEVFDSRSRLHTVSWFASQLNCDRTNIYNIFSRHHIDTELLMHICKILDHDFFADLSCSLHDEKHDIL